VKAQLVWDEGGGEGSRGAGAGGTALGVGGRGIGGGAAADDSGTSDASVFSAESFCSLLGETASVAGKLRFADDSRELRGVLTGLSASSLLPEARVRGGDECCQRCNVADGPSTAPTKSNEPDYMNQTRFPPQQHVPNNSTNEPDTKH
jgi:hypothetical protein